MTEYCVINSYRAMRSLVFVVLLILFVSPLPAQDEVREVPLPLVTLIQPPEAPKLQSQPLSMEKIQEIEQLIEDLKGANIKDVRFLNAGPYCHDFVPVGEFGTFGDWTGKTRIVSDPVRRLIEIGPDAIPYLLEGLENDDPTPLVVHADERRGAIPGGMAFDEVLHGNPANPMERRVLALDRTPYSTSILDRTTPFIPQEIESYRIRIGDVCFVILGHILGREYDCLSGGDRIICTPVHRESIRNRLKTIWETENPRQKLLESLLLDFSTRDLLPRDPLDRWDMGNRFQIESVKRLMFYYPEIATPLIAKRLQNLDVTGIYVDDCAANGVRTDDFIDAVGWCREKPIRDALQQISGIATEPEIKRALTRAGIQSDEK